MSLFVVLGEFKTNCQEARAAARPSHLARLQLLASQQKLVLAGPMPTDHTDTPTDFIGSMVVVDFEDRAALDVWLAEEPYLLANIYASVRVMPFKKVLP